MPHLPKKILANCIKFAAIPARPRTRPTLLTSICLTSLYIASRRFSSAPPHHTLTVRTDPSLIPQLLPLLSPSQRLLLSSTPTPPPPLHSTPHPAPPPATSIHTLTILPGVPPRPNEALIPWTYLEAAAPHLTNLHHLTWEPSTGTPLLASLLSHHPLTHVTLSATSPLAATPLHNLKSLTIFHTGPSDITPIRGITAPSATTLETLHLAFNPVNPTHITSALEGTTALPALRHLRLSGHDHTTIQRLQNIANLSSLESLQLHGQWGVDSPLQNMKRISIFSTPAEAASLISRCGALQEAHIVFSSHDPAGIARVVSAVAKHGATLQAVSLVMREPGMRGMAVTERDAEMLVEACGGVEDLRVGVGRVEFVKVVAVLARLRRLRALYLDVEDQEGVWTLPGRETMVPLSRPWYAEGGDKSRGPVGQWTEFEHALWHVLSAGRYRRLERVCFSAQGVDGDEVGQRLGQCYRLRERELPVARSEAGGEVVEGAEGYWGNQWVAPEGRRFAYVRGDGWVEAEVVDTAGVGKEPGEGRWTTAFKPAGRSTVWWEVVMR